MRPETTLDEWLQGITLGDGKAPRLNDAGIAFVTVSGEYSIGIAVNPETRSIGFVCFLTRAPEPAAGELMHHILSMNLALLAARNSTLAIDAESGMLVMGRTVAMDALDAERFSQFFAETAALADSLRATIGEASKTAKADPSPAESGLESQEHWLKL
jgi:hypothetical protein